MSQIHIHLLACATKHYCLIKYAEFDLYAHLYPGTAARPLPASQMLGWGGRGWAVRQWPVLGLRCKVWIWRMKYCFQSCEFQTQHLLVILNILLM